MRRSVVFTTTVVLVCAMAASIISCSRNASSKKGKKITEDSTWYDTDIYKINLGLDTSKPIEQSNSWIADSDDDRMVVITKGRYQMPNNVRTEEEANPYVIATVSVIDKKNNATIKTINLNGEITSVDDISGADLEDGKLTIKYSSYDMKTYQPKTVEKDLDLKSGKVTDTRDLSGADQEHYEKTFKVGGYTVNTAVVWGDNGGYYVLNVKSPDGSTKDVELKEQGVDFYGINLILPVNESTALITAFTNTGNKFYELDLKNYTTKALDAKDYEWLDADEIRNAKTINGNIYYKTPIGIFKIDTENKTTEKVLDYSECNVNRTLLDSLETTDCDGDTFTLCGKKFEGYGYNENQAASEFYIVKFSKAAKNPNAGKTVLDLFVPHGQVDDVTADAIIRFNEKSIGYFIEVSDRYLDSKSSDYSDAASDDEYESIVMDKSTKMCNSLAMDIMNGEGPDILLNSSPFGQLNSDSYLVDLAPYFKDLSSDKYFTNIIDAAKVNNKLYHMPVCISLEGIHTDKKNAGASGVGFTTEEYEKFLKETLNGKDIITSGQAHYFAKLFVAMNDKFIKDGKADFTGPEFKELADFVKNNVQEKARSWDDSEYGMPNNNAVYTNCYGTSGYFYELADLKGDLTILGIPSSDGRGPMFEAYYSVAVSAQASNTEACIEFVKLLLSDDIQESMALNENVVLNRDAFRKGGEAAVEYFNGPAGDRIFGYDHMTGQPIENRIKFSEKDISDLESIILSCSRMHSEDQAISIILIEEMPAYFLGQKDLNDVITILQDRVQKVLNERK